jgi:toxin ParE1/3/4
MAYQIEFSAGAEEDLERLYEWIVVQAPSRGPLWFKNLVRSIYSLARQPYRCPLAPENYQQDDGIRQLLFGKKPNVYRILYVIGNKQKAVYILHIRHGARRSILTQELGQPPWR